MAIYIGTLNAKSVALGGTTATKVALGSDVVWQDILPYPLCFTAEETNSTLRLDKNGSPNAISLETSTDGITWTDYGWTDKTGDTLTLTNIGDKVYMRAKTENTTISTNGSNYYKFVGTGSFGASGNIQSMLKADCSRTDAPSNCYQYLFNGCASLTSAPELPSTTLGSGCYKQMFYQCTGLTSAPALPTTTLATSCYSNMFQGCTSLTTAPALPATTLASYCYQNMFNGCTSLTTAPELPATTLASGCYSGMFRGCSNLNSITLAYTGNFSSTYFNSWVNGVAASGTLYYKGTDTATGASAIPTGWTVAAGPWLCFTSNEAGSRIRLDKVGTPNEISIETSTDGTTWTDYGWTDLSGDTLSLTSVGDKVYVRAKNENTTIGSSTSNYYKFVGTGLFDGTGSFSASGNIQSLLKADCSRTDAPSFCYILMFQGCSSLTTAPALPATTLASNCYQSMFSGCTSLTTAPALPATTLASNCYQSMFYGCTGLTSVPAISATTLASNCFYFMFQGCTNLNEIKIGYTGNFDTTYFGSQTIRPRPNDTRWMRNVQTTAGTFYYNGSDTTRGPGAIPENWTITTF